MQAIKIRRTTNLKTGDLVVFEKDGKIEHLIVSLENLDKIINSKNYYKIVKS